MSRSANHFFTGAGASGPANYIEDVFNIGLYTATGGSETFSILGNVDMYTKGGLVWSKSRNSATGNYLIRPTLPGGGGIHNQSNTTSGNDSFGTTEFKVNQNNTVTMANGSINSGGSTYVSWNFAKQKKFFDVVTYNGDSTAGKTVAHNLGSVPGTIIVKITSGSGSWFVYHRSLGATKYLLLDSTGGSGTSSGIWNNTEPTSSVFTLGNDGSVNSSGQTYVAYLFAHDAGGFGLTGTDNVISCGSYTGNGAASNPITLGYEPQWILLKRTDIAGDWGIIDTMRGWSYGDEGVLKPNTSGATDNGNTEGNPTATGFDIGNGNYNINTRNYIYIAIRRGPMKVPTVGTTVYNAIARTGTGTTASVTGVGFSPDTVWGRRKDANYGRNFDRLRGANTSLAPAVTSGEATPANSLTAYTMDGFDVGADASEHINASSIPYIYWNFKRAPGFFDVVCYTPSAYTDLIYHNLGVAPEMIIAKNRGATATQYYIHHTGLGASEEIYFNENAKSAGSAWTRTSTYWNNQSALYPTAESHVAYLFATCPGVSKVGSYTGTGTTLQVNCGFTGGARFVLIRRISSTGNWYVWDTVRGIISGNDPYLVINNISGSPPAEVTNTDYIDSYSQGFEISSTAPADINGSGGTFIFLAIA